MVSSIYHQITLMIVFWATFAAEQRSNAETVPVEYMLGCMQNKGSLIKGNATLAVSVLNFNSFNASVYISFNVGKSRNFSLQSKEIRTEMFNAEFAVRGSALSIQGIKVTSDQQLLVYGISYHSRGLGAFLSLPLYNQGYIYYVMTADTYGEFLVVGVYPNTCVNIMLRLTKSKITYNNIKYVNGSTITEILNEYHTMQIFSVGDFTGSEIRTSKPVSVLSGSRRYKRDHLVDQLPPIKSWGKKYITAPPNGFQYDCKVMSGVPNTVVNYTCAANTEEFIVLREAGSFQTLDFNTSKCLLISNEPILITIIVSSMDEETAMITMPPLKEVGGELMVYVSDMVTAAQLVLVTNTNITIDPTGSPSSTHIECPEHLKFCIINMENLICNQTYSVSSENERFVISGYVHGTKYVFINRTTQMNALGYPIVHHASQQSPSNQQADVTCGDSSTTSTTLQDTSNAPTPTITATHTTSLNKSCRCCSFKNYSLEELESIKMILREELFIKPNTTSMYVRSLTSAPDFRVSSKVIGYTSNIILGFLGICFVIADIENIVRMIKRIRRNLCPP